VRTDTRTALVARLSDAGRAVEVGIGSRTDVAGALAATGTQVTATDVCDSRREIPDDVRFVRDDVTDPERSIYLGADVLYALNLPPELQPPAGRLAGDVGAGFAFTTLGADPAVVPACPETLPSGTLFVADPQRA
jgi:uncharacterized UPF0146 family protein